jgi:penicillin-binding protein 1A
VRDLFPEPDEWKPKIGRRLLDLDSRVDSFMFQAGRIAREAYERYSTFMDRFHSAGWKRLAVELFSEGATVGLAAIVVMLVLAIPAFRYTAGGDWLKKSDLAITVLDRYGNKIGSRGIRHDNSVPLDEFPDYLIKAVIATEDRHFYEHFGIDVMGTLRAMVTNARAGGVVQGGSSITQQLAKNLFLSNERTLTRKINEAFLAFWLESHLSKNEILRLYLDRVYMGGGTFGIEAAAQYYFNKSVRDVTLAEAAMLAGLFKAPTKYSPNVNLPAARARANTVLDRLVAAGFMTEGQVFGARRNPATPVDRSDEEAPNYYLDYVYAEMKSIVDTLPKSMTDRVFVVRTALDANIQHAMEAAIENNLRKYGKDYGASQAASVLMDVDGSVRAMVGGRDYGESQFNRATDAMRQPGSSFKPYVYTTALLNGFTPNSRVVDAPICIGNWCPHNYSGGFRGAMSLTDALKHSINSVAVRLSVLIGHGNAKLGRAKIIATAHRMGIVTPLPDTPSLPIGADAVELLEHVGAYATLPNLGIKITPHAVLEVRTGDGRVVWRYDRDGPKPHRVLPAEVAKQMNFMMNKVVEEGTGRRAILDGIKAAGKTGTTNAYRDAWFMGFTGNYVCGVWMGNDNYQPTKKMTGGSLPAQTWHEIMAYAHQGIEIKPLVGPAQTATPPRPQIAAAEAAPAIPPRPILLSKSGAHILEQIEQMMDRARRALPPLSVSSAQVLPAGASAPAAITSVSAGNSANFIERN